MFRRVVALWLSLSLALVALVVLEAPVQAHQPSVVAPSAGLMPSAVPSAITPNVDDTNGAVWSVAQVGNTLVVGGTFTSVGNQPHVNLAAFNATTGALSSSFSPSTNGQVYSVLPGPNDHTVYVAGQFTQVNGQPAQFLSLLDTGTGQIVSSFVPPVFNFGMIRDMVKVGNRLYVAGFFTKAGGKAHGGLVSLNATTGALDSFMNVQLAGHHNNTGQGAQGYVGPWALDASPDGKRLVVIGNFRTADGLPRDQVVMIDIDGAGAVVDPRWATLRYAPYCFNFAFDSYVRGVSFSPDGSYLVINATGGGVRGTLCDASARFETASTGTSLEPTWVDESGGDTVWGVTITDTAVFIGGHNRWNNNPLGSDRAEPGAVPRPGMAALDPVSGRPFTWNPGHNPLGDAVYAYLATDKGLWMGYDSNWIGNTKYRRQKIAFFPYAGGGTVASTTLGKLPGTVYLGNNSSNGPSNVLYRVDSGGPAVDASDGGPDWAEDSGANPSPYQNHQSNAADWGPVPKVTSAVPTSTPRSIFDHERWSPTDSPPMNYSFPVVTGTHVTVRLYFANRCTCTSLEGQRHFDVSLNGSTVLDNYDIVKDVGDQTGTMKSFGVTSPGSVDLSFTHRPGGENPLINGIEIINDDVSPPPAPTDNLSAVAFDGTSASAPQPVSGTSIPWGQTRGAFTVGNKLFYGSSDGSLYQAPVSGSTIGTPTKVDPYHDPVWAGVDSHDGTTFDGNSPQLYSQLPSVTGMFYSGGRLYFTMSGESSLRSAWFSPDSGIVDQIESTVSSSVDFSKAGGMFLSGNTLYYVNKTDKGLYSVAFNGGAVTGPATLVNGPSTGGVNWTNRSMFFTASPPAPANQPPTASFTSNCTSGGCAFDASASSDSDGSIVSYSWNFGDGSGAGTGVTTSHNYSAAGTYSVKLTVTDNSGASTTQTNSVTVANQKPTAAFLSSCAAGVCSFDASSSSDPDGTIASYSWDFGDGGSGTGQTPNHTFAATGTYSVKLTVTDNGGATGTVTKSVSVTVAPPTGGTIAFVGASHSGPGATLTKSVTIPVSAKAGDTALLVFTQTAGASWAGPGSGWTLVGTPLTNSTITSTAWVKSLTTADLGSSVTMTSPSYTKAVLGLGVYSGVSASNPVDAFARVGDAGQTNHTSPTVTASAGDWLVTFWTDKSPDVSSYVAPAGVTQRDTAIDNGTSGRYSELLADSNGPVSAGPAGGLTATTDTVSGRGIMWTVALKVA